MTGTLATALSAFFSPSPPRGMIRSTTPSWPASSASSSRPPPPTSDRAPEGRPGDRRGLHRDAREHLVGVRRHRGAAQHDRVAGLQRQRRGVDRHVRARLVDDRDHAQRHADLAHVEPVGQPEAVEHLADRVGERDDRAHAVGHRGHAALVEREAVHQRRREAGLAARLEVARVGLQDLRHARLQRGRDREQRGVLDGRAGDREPPRGGLRVEADLGDGAGGSDYRSHTEKV